MARSFFFPLLLDVKLPAQGTFREHSLKAPLFAGSSVTEIHPLKIQSGQCNRQKRTHQEVQYDHVYEVHQSCALVVWRCLFHHGAVLGFCLPPENHILCKIK